MSRFDFDVDDLMRIFRSALVSVIPHLERARVPWLDGAGSGWSVVSESFFAAIVDSAFQHGSEINPHEIRLPRYGRGHQQGQLDWLEVARIGELGSVFPLSFVRFETQLEPFDSVLCTRLLPGPRSDLPESEEASHEPYQLLPFAEVEFALRVWHAGTWSRPLTRFRGPN